jgi:hypothetical protein
MGKLMADRWESFRGDDWFFKNTQIIAEAEYKGHTNIFEITSVATKLSPPLQPTQLFALLQTTASQFPDMQLICTLDSSTEKPLDALAQQNQIDWAPIINRHTKSVKINSIASTD